MVRGPCISYIVEADGRRICEEYDWVIRTQLTDKRARLRVAEFKRFAPDLDTVGRR